MHFDAVTPFDEIKRNYLYSQSMGHNNATPDIFDSAFNNTILLTIELYYQSFAGLDFLIAYIRSAVPAARTSNMIPTIA